MSVAVVSKSQPVPQLGHIRTAAHGFSQELLSLAGAVLSQELLSFFECRRAIRVSRSEEHTSELQSRLHLVCRLLLEKKKTSTRSVAVLRASERKARRRATGSLPTIHCLNRLDSPLAWRDAKARTVRRLVQGRVQPDS